MHLSLIDTVLLLAAIAAVACLYSSVGHGGATGYLATMSLLGVPATLARPGALWMNCVVAAVAFWRFRQRGFFVWSIFWPLALVSIPLAWLGSRLFLEGWVYSGLLGLALLTTGWLMGWGYKDRETCDLRPVTLPLAFAVGGGLGFLAGLTGIGGGVYLTPTLILLHWTSAKTAGGISALFILVNSIAGLAGLGHRALIGDPMFLIAPLLAAGAAFVGTYMSIRRWNTITFRRILAVVLWIAAVKNLQQALQWGPT